MKWLRYATVTPVTGVSVLTPYAGAYRNNTEVAVTRVTPPRTSLHASPIPNDLTADLVRKHAQHRETTIL